MKPATVLVPVACVLLAGACSKPASKVGTVVVYTTVRAVIAQPVAERFEKATGIEVKLVLNTEETKITSLLNRLVAEKDRPQCDVFWSGDPVQASLLKAMGVSAAYESPAAGGMALQFSDAQWHFVSFSSRARAIIYNTNLCPPGQEPKSVRDLTDAKWKGQACLANPLEGTTAMQAAAWFETMGEARAKAFFAALRENQVKMLSSNDDVTQRVGAGNFTLGLTDSDDAIRAMLEGKPVGFVLPDQEDGGTLLVPNAAVLIAGAPHAENGKRFIDYLLSAENERALAESDAAQIPLRAGVPGPAKLPPVEKIRAMPVDYGKLANWLDVLQAGFLREWAAQQRW